MYKKKKIRIPLEEHIFIEVCVRTVTLLTLVSYSTKQDSTINLFKVANKQTRGRVDQIMSKVLTFSKYFRSPEVFATTFCFADAKRIILLLLITASY